MLGIIARLVALAIFVWCGLHVMRTILMRPETVADAGGPTTVLLLRPLVWAVVGVLIYGVIRWLRAGRQGQTLITAILAIAVVVLLAREFIPDAMSDVGNLLIPTEGWVWSFTGALAVCLVLAIFYIFGIQGRIPRRWKSRKINTKKEGGEVSAA